VELDAHLFRRESGRMVAALTRLFGVHNLTLAEDVVQDAFLRAHATWPLSGVPDNPSAWLMATAKNRALDVVRRHRTAKTFAPELQHLLATEWTLTPLVDEAFAAHVVRDEQLRMMFSCCHPKLPEDAQLALILNILCGFGAHEIAQAFLASHAAIEKRITRGKHTLAEAQRLFDLGDAELATRLGTVQHALYLLFNEGYHGTSDERAVRVELCDEARHLTALLCAHPQTATPATFALAALMALHGARLPARRDATGDLSALADQDRTRWDQQLIADGLALLNRSATGLVVSAYHLEAAIAAEHARAATLADTAWERIVLMYDRLMIVAPSPVVALSRAIAIAERDGPERGLVELRALAERERLARYPFFAAAEGELELRGGAVAAARVCFERALALARNDAERRFFERRLAGVPSERP